MLKKLLKNRIVGLSALTLASFAMINGGMYFFLKATQPRMGARVETARPSAPAGNTKADPKPAPAKAPVVENSAPMADSLTAAVPSTDTADVETPVTASLVESELPQMPAEAQFDAEMSSVDSTPIAMQDDSAASDADEIGNAFPEDSKEISKLAKLLESVKPAEAATIAAQLETDQVVALMMKMKDRNAGRMLAAMPKERAARVALRMSEMAAQSRGKS